MFTGTDMLVGCREWLKSSDSAQHETGELQDNLKTWSSKSHKQFHYTSTLNFAKWWLTVKIMGSKFSTKSS